ncbi:MAG: outer membrane protein transport protein [Moraxellaceae bacterium]|nr:outer membrane protein transport protein [Moraxellaceae bacterium]
MKMLPKTLALMIAVASGSAWSAGFALNEQSIKSMGMAQAGRASAAADATTLFGNPAGMTQLEGTNLSGNATFIYVPTDIENVQGSQAGTNNGDMIPPTWVGSGFISHQMSDDLTIGIGNFAPFGLASNYESSFQGRYFGDKSKVKVIGIQPTIAYKLTPEFSIGVGVTVSKLEGLLSAAVAPIPSNPTLEVNGDDISYGYNVGVLWQVMPQTRIGFDYRSKTDYNLEGTSEVNNLPVSGFTATYDAKLDIATPATFELSISHALNPNVNVHSSISLTQWSVIENLVIKNSGAPASLSTIIEELDWKDSWAYSVGADWKAGDSLTLRAGLGIDKTPVSDSHRSVRVPSEDRMVATLGLSYPINDSTSIDVAYMFLKEDTAHVDVSKTTPAGPVTYSADYKGMGHLIGAQLNMKF